MEKIQPDMEKDLDILLMFNDELYDIYAKLKDLEIEQKSNNSEFKQLIERAKQIIQLTSTVEDRITTNLDDTQKLIKLLDEQMGIPYTSSAVKFLKCYGLPKDKMILVRIANSLSQKFGQSFTKSKNIPALTYRNGYKMLLNNNIDLMILSKIKRNGLFEDESLKEHFYRIKYDMLFSNPELEKALLDANVQIDERPFIIRNGFNSLLGVSKEESVDCEYDTIAPLIAGNMSLICKSDEELCSDKSKTAQTIAFTYGILSALLLADNEELINSALEAVKSAFDKTKDTSTFVVVNNLLEIILEDFEKDKSMYQFISFGGR